RLARFANGEILPFIARITETHFPIPCLEIVGELSHLTAQPNVEQLVPVSEVFVPYTGVVDAAEPNPSRHRNGRSVNNQCCVSNCEGIKRILDRHTDAEGTAGPYRWKRRTVDTVKSVEWVRRKWHRGQRRIEVRARIFKVGKYGQVLVAQVAGERAVVHLSVSRRQRWRNRGEVKGDVVPISRNPISKIIKVRANTSCPNPDIERRSRRVGSRMWRRGVCAEEQTRDQTGTATTSNVTREIAAACVKSAKPVEITVGRNIAVAAENAAG